MAVLWGRKACDLQKIGALNTEEICQLINSPQIGFILIALFDRNQFGNLDISPLCERLDGQTAVAPRQPHKPAKGKARFRCDNGCDLAIENGINRESASADFAVTFELRHPHAPCLRDIDLHALPPFSIKASA